MHLVSIAGSTLLGSVERRLRLQKLTTKINKVVHGMIKFNKLFLALSILAASISTSANAASTADLAVTGSITPAACTPLLANGGVLDYGDLPASQFAGLTQAQLEVKGLDFTITCSTPTIIALTARDATPGSAAPVWEYDGFHGPTHPSNNVVGLGRTIDGKRIGAAVILIDQLSFTDKGSAVDSLFSYRSAPDAWALNSYGVLGPDYLNSFASPGSLTPVAVSNLSGRLGASPVISISRPDSDGLTFDDVIDFQANAVVEVIYL